MTKATKQETCGEFLISMLIRSLQDFAKVAEWFLNQKEIVSSSPLTFPVFLGLHTSSLVPYMS